MKRILRHPATQAAFAHGVGLYLWFTYLTTRWVFVGSEHLAPYVGGAPMVCAFWHERLPLMPKLWLLARNMPGGGGARVHVLVSQHRDGRFIGTVMRWFRIDVVFGSSSKGGAASTRALLTLMAKGEQVGITPDGPRGPRRVAAAGVAQLAALAGVVVLPTAAQISHRKVLRSWDRMVVPLPFGRGVVVVGTPIAVPRRDWQASTAIIEAALTDAADRADQLCGL